MAIYDYRASAGWNYKPMPIEWITIWQPVEPQDTILFDNILQGGVYDILPIIRSRDTFSGCQKVVGYTATVSITLLFDNLGLIVPKLDTYFKGKMCGLTLHLNPKNMTGELGYEMDIFINAVCNYKIIKGETQPQIQLDFTNSFKPSDFNSIITFGTF